MSADSTRETRTPETGTIPPAQAARAAQVTLDGRRRTCRRTALWAVCAAALYFFLLVDSAIAGASTSFWGTPSSTFLFVVTLCLAASAIVRALGVAAAREGLAHAKKAATKFADANPAGRAGTIQPDEPPTGRIIVCSGGGIKSASFCLGALQRLSLKDDFEKGFYEAATHLIGVSGGGYIAGSYAAAHYRSNAQAAQVKAEQDAIAKNAVLKEGNAEAKPAAERQPPQEMPQAQAEPVEQESGVFADGGRDVAALRKRTNFLTSSKSVRYDLVMSMLFGIIINLAILGSVLVTLAMLISEQVHRVNLVSTEGDWTYNPMNQSVFELTWASLLMITASLALFLFGRFRGRPGKQLWNPKPQRGEIDEEGLTLREWFSDAPSVLAGAAIVLFILYPCVPFFAFCYHGLAMSGVFADWGWWQRAAVGLAGVLGFFATVRSAWKGLAVGAATTPLGRVMEFFRRTIVPWLGVTFAVIAAYVLLTAMTAGFLPEQGLRVWSLLLAGLLPVAVIRSLGTANNASMYPFYRDRLDWAFFQYKRAATNPAHAAPDDSWGASVKRISQRLAKPIVDRLPPKMRRSTARPRLAPPVNFVDLANSSGQPELVLVATANVMDGDLLPSGRNGTPFVFSNTVGLTDQNLPRGNCMPSSSEYAKRGSRFALNVRDAVAISGAAIAPISGREYKVIRAYRFLLALANVRLGVWVRNPYWTTAPREDITSNLRRWAMRASDLLDHPSPITVAQEALGTLSINAPFLYLTDGGHYDNLGLVEALRRRPEQIIMLDGSGDEEDKFSAMGDAIATARMDLGVQIDFRPGVIQRKKEQYPRKAWIKAKATYRDRTSCDIVYVKSVLPEGMPFDLENYKVRNPDFPSTSSKNEMYDEFDFEAYRCLGWNIVDEVIKSGDIARSTIDSWAALSMNGKARSPDRDHVHS